MKPAKLQEILQKHKKWLDGDNIEGVKADLRDANLRDANLCGADLFDADLRAADLRGADLRDADLSKADLFDADLRGADLSNADLRNADLRKADLRNANLCNANLRNANLRKADLRGANLRDANLYGADLDFSCLPMWCGGLDVQIDDRLARQILYHLLRNVAYSNNTSEELKSLLLTPELLNAANQFHRVDECGKIKVPKEQKEKP